MTRSAALALLAFLLLLGSARAADRDVVRREWRAAAGGVVEVENTWSTAGGKPKGTVLFQARDAALAAKGASLKIYDGPVALSALAVRDGAAAVVLYRGGSSPFVKVALVDLAASTFRVVDLPRVAASDYAPSAAVACPDGEGFTILWQELKTTDATAEAQSALARVKADGTVLKKPASVPIPWSLGAIVDDGRGYTLVVRYDGSAPDQTRLCFVTLTRDGQPEQHPWWGSRPALVGDVELAMIGGKATAIYHGGTSILAVTANKDKGQWGQEAEASQTLATNAADAAFAVRDKGGKIELVKR